VARAASGDAHRLRSRGDPVLEHRATALEPSDTPTGGVTVTTASGQRVRADRLLVATGRTPRTAGLNVGAAGVKTDERGFIIVDDQQRTANPRVFAAGDVTGGPQYVYVAAAQGRVAARNAFGGRERVDYTGLPAVMFTRPQLASAGLSEYQARQDGYPCDCRVLALGDVPRALVNGDTLGAVKIVAAAATSPGPGGARRRRGCRRVDARRHLRHQDRHDRHRPGRYLGALPDHGRKPPPDRENVRPRKAAPHLLLRLTPRPRRDRAGPTAPHRFGYDSTHHPLKETAADV